LRFFEPHQVLNYVFDSRDRIARLRHRLGVSYGHLNKIRAGNDSERRCPIARARDLIDEAVILDRIEGTRRAREIPEFLMSYYLLASAQAGRSSPRLEDNHATANEIVALAAKAAGRLNILDRHVRDFEALRADDKAFGDLEQLVRDVRAALQARLREEV
jgi:hypothetical protein